MSILSLTFDGYFWLFPGCFCRWCYYWEKPNRFVVVIIVVVVVVFFFYFFFFGGGGGEILHFDRRETYETNIS